MACARVQWLTHPGPELADNFSGRELLWLVALGAVLEGYIEPWWHRSVDEGMRRHGAPSNTKGVRTLRFVLNTLVWTPLCCELVFLVEHLFVKGAAVTYVEDPGAALRDVLSQFDLEVAESGAVDAKAGEVLAEDVQASSAWDAVATGLSQLLPPPLRPVVRKFANASSWTLLDFLEP